MTSWRLALDGLLAALLAAASAAPAAAVERSLDPAGSPATAAAAPAAAFALPSASDLSALGVPSLAAPGLDAQLPASAVPAVVSESPVPASLAAAVLAAPSAESARPPAGVPSGVQPGAESSAVLPASAKGQAPSRRRVAVRKSSAKLGSRELPSSSAKPAEESLDALFDGRRAKPVAAEPIPAGRAAAFGVLAPVALLARHVPLHALTPLALHGSVAIATSFSVASPMPRIYRTFREGEARHFPFVRTLIGAAGAFALGAFNGPLLHEAFWGIMVIFTSLTLIAPFFIGRSLRKRGAGELAPLGPAQGKNVLSRALWRLKADTALRKSVAAAAFLLALSAGIYALSGELLAALGITAATAGSALLLLQLLKAGLFLFVFAPDGIALLQRQRPHALGSAYAAMFLTSALAYIVWGLLSAAGSPAGPVRDQFLVLVGRNVVEGLAAAISFLAARKWSKS